MKFANSANNNTARKSNRNPIMNIGGDRDETPVLLTARQTADGTQVLSQDIHFGM
jgi:hypothetical protein